MPGPQIRNPSRIKTITNQAGGNKNELVHFEQFLSCVKRSQISWCLSLTFFALNNTKIHQCLPS